MFVKQFVFEGLGDSSHMVGSEQVGVAAVIDPLRDVDIYLDAANELGVRITHIFETHLHNDFISGSRELNAKTGAAIYASAGANLQFEHQPLREGDEVRVGDLVVQVIETLGHTPEHVSYLVRDETAPSEAPVLFSGGSLLVGSVSRTDLLGREHAVDYAHDLYRSLHDKILKLPDNVEVYPTHGGGSFCTVKAEKARSTTIGAERRFNRFLQAELPEEFAEELLENLPRYPTYFKYMSEINRKGPRILGKLPELAPLSAQEVLVRQEQGEAVVDTRPVFDYVAGHIPNAYEVHLRPAFATWVGWVVPFGAPIVIVSNSTDVHEEVVRQLIRIGYDNLSGYLDGGMAAWEGAGLPIARHGVITAEELRRQLDRGEPVRVLDVRTDAEWEAGHIPEALHIEAGILPEQGLAVPEDEPIVAHCGTQERSATSLSVLERLGFKNLRLIPGGWAAWEKAGLPIKRE